MRPSCPACRSPRHVLLYPTTMIPTRFKRRGVPHSPQCHSGTLSLAIRHRRHPPPRQHSDTGDSASEISFVPSHVCGGRVGGITSRRHALSSHSYSRSPSAESTCDIGSVAAARAHGVILQVLLTSSPLRQGVIPDVAVASSTIVWDVWDFVPPVFHIQISC